MDRVPINDLSRNVGLRDEVTASIARVIDRGRFVLGEEGDAFEREFAAFCGVEHCVGLANGTNALELALRALNIQAGDRVATVANAGMYSTIAILIVGAIPVYVDIDPQTMLMSHEALVSVLQGDIAAVIVTHLYGRMADIPTILKITERLDIHVIEDCAQAHGAQLKSRRAGAWGIIGCFSFYPTKNLGAVGDAGAITTNDTSLAHKLRRLRQYGWEEKYRSIEAGGINSRLDEIQAAVLRTKLPHLEPSNMRRRAIAEAYQAGIDHPRIRKPMPADEGDVCHLFILRTRFRRELQAHLDEHGIDTDLHYPLPDYRQPSISEMFKGTSLRYTEEACDQVLTIPCFPGMQTEEVNIVIQAIGSWRPG